MSLEAAAEEERLKVMRRLEEETKPKKQKSPSLNQDRSESPPVRSMLDVSSGKLARHGSIAGIGVGITAGATTPQSPTYRSMLDITSPIPEQPQQHVGTRLSSPTSPQSVSRGQRRSSIDAIPTPTQGLPRISDDGRQDPLQKHQFDMLPSIASQALPKRAAQGGKKPADNQSPKAMAAAISGDLSALPGFGRAREGRHNSTVGIGGKSRSPSSRLAPRSESPGALNLIAPGSARPSNAYVTNSGKVVDMDKAYRKLSNRSQGSNSFSTDNSADFAGGGRVHEDPVEGEDNEGAVESEDEAEGELSTDEDEMSPESARGRRRSRRKKGSTGSEMDTEETEGASGSTLGMGQVQGPRQIKSLMAAAEDERKLSLVIVRSSPSTNVHTGKKVSAHYVVKSLLEPEISVTSPSGEKVVSKKAGVYPNTSFDENPASAASSQPSSDIDGDFSDIKRAQRLSINMSTLDTSISNRTIQTILRGDWPAMEEEVKQERRRARLYIVATDLSDEALYALEWTIGTILRDGDTMIAMYAIDEEAAATKGSESDAKSSAQFGEGVKAAHDMARSMAAQTEKTKQHPIVAHNSSSLVPSNYMPATETKSLTGSTDSRAVSKHEVERFHAVENISQTCIRLLRKTRLQVRIFVEVIHCKSPKHMLTGAVGAQNMKPVYLPC